ncbi:MAG TPA: GNAT family N-acetyltransferase [Bacillales bacterium]|nr:GNAT family N-acetyltransferase [Bacillales bacterium]
MHLTAFGREHLTEAAQLLAKRHQNERRRFPELPGMFENEKQALKALTASFEQPLTHGMAAFKEGRMAAYLMAHVHTDSERGRNVRMAYPDLACGPGHADLFRDLYAEVAEDWLNIGCFSHYVYAPLGDPALLSPWLNLGFAYQQAYAILDLRKWTGHSSVETEFVFREAVVSDRQALRGASGWISVHQSRSPGFVPILPEVSNEIEQGYEGMIDDENAKVWVAEHHGEMVGFQAYWPVEGTEDHIDSPENAVELTVAATNPDFRNRGIAKGLTEFTLTRLKKTGIRYCVTNWYLLNLLSSRFWPKRGFQPYCYRLYRTIDANIFWANGTNGNLLKKMKKA